ncbi:MAG: uracil-DNA glycosylase [Oscillibacter sp.]|nr:uracil-DNA glycosylase [Oscillibacter sp.]
MDTWETLEQECGSCHACPLGNGRQRLVFGDGCRTAEIMFIGEGPGQREDEEGIPFVGPAGKLLDDMMELIGLDRSKVYIANVVKCRPPRNRDPMNVEQEMCLPWLRRQTALLRPKMIVCLGRIAAQAVMKPDFRITKEHGQWIRKAGVWITAIYHPSALLRDVYKRPETFLDLKAIQAKAREICSRTDLSTP